ncbi:MAG: hypothetical protein LBP89_02385 [Helicobacteraceae bacterium]|jgi:hypothetical protein|nr:hypothetical protein [Helicobacteraceae bacterium]
MEINAVRIGSSAYLGTQTSARSTNAPQNAVSDLSLSQKSVKAQSETLKSDNDLFGATKTLERSLAALKTIATALKNGEIDRQEAAKTIADRVENTRYKNENLYENFPLKDSAINVRNRVDFDENGDIDAYALALDNLIKENADALSAVKSRLLGETKKLGEAAQKSYEQSGLKTVDPSSIVASTNADYLKTQFAKLTRLG